MKLAEVHQRRGDLKTAVAEASAAVEATGDSKDMYLAPERMRLLAELEVALGNKKAADELYQRATDIIEGMVSSAPDTPVNGGIKLDQNGRRKPGQWSRFDFAGTRMRRPPGQ